MALGSLYKEYEDLQKQPISTADKVRRGFALEEIIYRVCKLEMAGTYPSLRSDHDQIDGGIQHKGIHYLFEIKWREKPQTGSDLSEFLMKFDSRLEGTRGIIISISGYSRHFVDSLNKGKKSNILLWGREQVEAVLSGKIKITDLIDLSVHRASAYGEFLLPPQLKLPVADPTMLSKLAYRYNFSDLIQHYIKTFGGRESEMEAITQFVDTAPKGYLLIEGLSGYGKTALLANMVNKNTSLIYHFFSQSYNITNGLFTSTSEIQFLKSIIHQLSAHHNIPDKEYKDEELRPVFYQLLSNSYHKKTVIFLDAIDEISPIENFLKGLLPKKLGDAVFVVISARTAGKPEQLEADYFLSRVGISRRSFSTIITLKGLSVADVRSIIDRGKVNGKRVALEEEALAQIVQITEGDPFYVRFLIEDLQEGYLQPTDLATLPKGVENYLDHQFELLSKNMDGAYRIHRELIIGFIVHRDHPVPVKTLINLVNEQIRKYEPKGLERLSAFNMDIVLAPIRRFLLRTDEAYSFCHKRFQEYFKNKMK